MTMEIIIDGKNVSEYTIRELVSLKYSKQFSIEECRIINDWITIKIEGGEE